jgi:hypothetical protein
MSSTKILNQVNDEINKLIIELNQTTDRNIQLIEERIAFINQLLVKVDKAVSILNKDINKHESSKLTYQNIKPKSVKFKEQTELDFTPKNKKSVKEEALELFHMGISPNMIAKKLGKTLGEIELMISLEEKK